MPGQKRISVKKYEELYKLYCDTLEYVMRIRRETLLDARASQEGAERSAEPK